MGRDFGLRSLVERLKSPGCTGGSRVPRDRGRWYSSSPRPFTLLLHPPHLDPTTDESPRGRGSVRVPGREMARLSCPTNWGPSGSSVGGRKESRTRREESSSHSTSVVALIPTPYSCPVPLSLRASTVQETVSPLLDPTPVPLAPLPSVTTGDDQYPKRPSQETRTSPSGSLVRLTVHYGTPTVHLRTLRSTYESRLGRPDGRLRDRVSSSPYEETEIHTHTCTHTWVHTYIHAGTCTWAPGLVDLTHRRSSLELWWFL